MFLKLIEQPFSPSNMVSDKFCIHPKPTPPLQP
jgi:hypothetical protein